MLQCRPPCSFQTKHHRTISFNPQQHPLPVPVWILPHHVNHSEIKHFLRDGADQSPFLIPMTGDNNFTHDVNGQKTVWLVDMMRLGFRGGGRFCYKTLDWARQRNSATNETWPIHFIDWRDSAWNVDWCHAEEFLNMIGIENIVYHKRSLVMNRTFDNTTRTIVPGEIRSFPDWQNYSSVPPKHAAYAVRTDIVRELFQIVKETFHLDMEETCFDLASQIPRPKEVVHYWPIITPAKILRMSGRTADWREEVSRGIQDWGKHNSNSSVFTNFSGEADDKGRNEVSNSYVASMLQFKIVVVCQRNDWEDHYRLFEALVSGALVFTDTMLTLPEGLVDNDNIVVYSTVKDMQDRISWYLHPVNATLRENMARRGRDVAMRRHRSWHRVEEMVFGTIQSSY
jgi:hypothetical protein